MINECLETRFKTHPSHPTIRTTYCGVWPSHGYVLLSKPTNMYNTHAGGPVWDGGCDSGGVRAPLAREQDHPRALVI